LGNSGHTGIRKNEFISNNGGKGIMNDYLLSLIRGIGCSDIEFELLYFFSRHPSAKLSLYTIVSALHISRSELMTAITSLVEKGILIVQHHSNGLTTYAMSHQQCQEYMDELIKLDWSSCRSIKAELGREAVLAC
jgi:predicted transcriptional regulator